MPDGAKGKISLQKSKNGCYSFGSRFYYWDKYKGLKDIEHEGPNEGYRYKNYYIKQKYKNLQEEITDNTIFTINLSNFASSYFKAKIFLNQEHAKCMKATGSLCSDYGIKESSNLTVQHLMAVILYTDHDKLSYNFSSTFRKLSQSETFGDQKRRNREYSNWSRLLRETVELFGTEMTNSKVDTFYHGVSKLIFSSFVSFFASPTSTTAQLEVATVFANENGLILELEKSSRSLKYFNCTWLSFYGSEDERLFCGGLFPIHFNSIRDMNTNENYEKFIHSLTSFNYSINGQQTFSSQHEINKMDAKIIKLLHKHYDESAEYKNKFPHFINDIFSEFCKEKKFVKINEQRLHKIMKKILFKKECESLIDLKFLSIFNNLEKISIEYDLIFRPDLDETFFDLLHQDLIEMEHVNNLSLELKRVNYDKNVLIKYQNKLSNDKIFIEETGSLKNKSLLIKFVCVTK